MHAYLQMTIMQETQDQMFLNQILLNPVYRYNKCKAKIEVGELSLLHGMIYKQMVMSVPIDAHLWGQHVGYHQYHEAQVHSKVTV